MDDTQPPTELKQETSDVAALPPADADVTATASESQAALSQGSHHLSFFPLSFNFNPLLSSSYHHFSRRAILSLTPRKH